MVTSLLGRPRYVKRTGTPAPGATPLGTRTTHCCLPSTISGELKFS